MGVTNPPATQAEALRYATLLEWGTRIGLVLLVFSFAAYVSGWYVPHVPLDRLPSLWGLPVNAFHEAARTPQSWDWQLILLHGDHANMVGIGVLAACSLPSLMALVPLFLKQRNGIVYAAICVLEALVLVLAASGVLTSGH
jgi:hypothetical protein